MKKFLSVLCTTILVLGLAGVAGAGSYTLTPNPANLWGLDHHKYYTWGIDWEVPAGENITGASLIFHQISNWDQNPYDLWVHLLDFDSPTYNTVVVGTDNQGGGDYFDSSAYTGTEILLNHWDETTGGDSSGIIPGAPAPAVDITYDFNPSELVDLTSYVADGFFGLGFDPDCHFWNQGIELRIETGDPVVPEPSTALLVGLGLVGLIGLGGKRFKK